MNLRRTKKCTSFWDHPVYGLFFNSLQFWFNSVLDLYTGTINASVLMSKYK